MKRRDKLFLTAALLLAAGLLAVLFWRVRPLTGHISAFRYDWGHVWDGYQVYGIFTEDDTVYAKRAFEATDGMAYPAESWEMTAALTDEESAAFDKLILNTLRLPNWKDRYEPKIDTYDASSWYIHYTWNGKEYSTSGYAVFPDGLAQIRAFFDSLDWPDQPG